VSRLVQMLARHTLLLALNTLKSAVGHLRISSMLTSYNVDDLN